MQDVQAQARERQLERRASGRAQEEAVARYAKIILDRLSARDMLGESRRESTLGRAVKPAKPCTADKQIADAWAVYRKDMDAAYAECFPKDKPEPKGAAYLRALKRLWALHAKAGARVFTTLQGVVCRCGERA